jgi:hypothetical protein
MRHLIPLILVLAGVVACSKPKDSNSLPTSPNQPDTAKSTTPAKPADSLLSIHLINPDSSGQWGANFELIISEAGGKVLLDTIATFNTNIAATLKTIQPRVNVTTILHYTQGNNYTVYVRRAVKPALWTNLASPIVNPLPNSFPSNLVYTHVPLGADTTNILFSSLGLNNWNKTYDASQQMLGIGYTGRSGDNYAYLQIPNLGLFSYQPIHTAYDTISLARMDTMVKARFQKPAQAQLDICFLSGYMDTTDMMKFRYLYRFGYRMSGDSIQYPPKNLVPVQKYYLYTGAVSTIKNESYNYMTYTDTVPTTLPYPTAPIYTINSRLSSGFSISFTQKPTLYTSNWTMSNISIEVASPPDSTTLDVRDLALSLKSKWLQSANFDVLQLGDFTYSIIDGGDYDSWFGRRNDSVQALKPWPSELFYVNYHP